MTAIYLDYNGSSPVDPRVAEAITTSLLEGVGNASSVHAFGRRQAAAVDQGRQQVAALVGANSNHVTFTAGATEANNLALQGLVDTAPEGRSRILISSIEHASVRECGRWLAATSKAKVDIIPATPAGNIDMDAFAHLLSDDVRLVSVMAANSETGIINNIATIAEMTHAVGAVMHTDATQYVGRLDLEMTDTAVDLVSISSHKICGPGGVGALIATRKANKELQPLIHGGGHERGLRSGSLNVAGIVGFGLAAELAKAEQPADASRMADLRDQLVGGIQAGLENVTQNGDPKQRLPNTANLRFAGADAQAVLVNLDPVAVSTGSACSSGTIEPSPVLLAMGIDRQPADEAVRFSVGRFTTQSEIEEATTRTIEAVNFVRSMTTSP